MSLAQTYRDYIACINAKTMVADLPKYCQPTVMHNGVVRSLDEYRFLMENAQDCIADLNFKTHTLIVDEEKQQVAALLEFTGTPVKVWEGVEPNGKSVEFSEHVFYWFEGGKIHKVISLVDVETFRKQMEA